MNSLLKLFIKYLRKLVVFLEKKLKPKNQGDKTSIHTLAPKILTAEEDLKRIEPYLKRLREAIDTEGINNIALAGSYGSGKSTIIKTFQKLYNGKYEFLNISLASFTDKTLPAKSQKLEGQKSEGQESGGQDLERKLEISILQQMFYHVKPSAIPDSRFKRIINLPPWKLFLQAALLIIWILSALILYKFNKIEKLNPEGWSLNYQIDWIALLSAIVFFVGLGLIIKKFFRLFNNSKINKINIKGELELGEAIEKSVFNQHLEEILYFFEKTDFNVVVIEDVDRFNSTDIFTKLREINILINNSIPINRRVKFIYALRDEMFTDKNERVKFFEFIIPVIPFINPSNASDQLTKLIEESNLGNALSPDFTSDVVTFIDDIDMRLLLNIFQEFLIYRESLSKDLVQDNLFAIIVYKNMYPDDFGELGKRKGNLYKFLSNKALYTEKLIIEVKNKIEAINQRIGSIENEVDKPKEELRAVYINRLISRLNGFCGFNIGNRQLSSVEALSDKNFNLIQTSDNIHYMSSIHGYPRPTASGIRFSSIENEVSDLTYDQRERLLVDRANNEINKLKAEREKLRNRVQEIEGLSIKEIFEEVNIEEYLANFKENYLMRNLLLNGYIDEHYDDYISLFHEVSLTKEDFAFERKVKSGFNSDFNYSITKVENLLKRLPDKYFKRETILNYDLVDCLLENKTKYKDKLDNLFKGLSADGERQFQFIYGFAKRNPNEHIDSFIKSLCAQKPTFWQYLNNKSGLPEDEVKKLLVLIFEFGDMHAIQKFEEVETLVRFFEEINDFFVFCSPLKQKKSIQLFLSQKEVSIEKLDRPKKAKDALFDYVYKNNLYTINEHNISIIIDHYKKSIDPKKLKTGHYSALLKSGLEDMLSYIHNNLEVYIENVMLKIDENVKEDEGAITDIINREDIGLALKTRLVVKQETILSSISSITDNDVRQVVLLNNKVKPTWANVFDYLDALEADDFDEPLNTFLNIKENHQELSKTEIEVDAKRDDEYIGEVSSKILYNDGLNDDAYSFLIQSIPLIYDQLDYEKLSVIQIEHLLSEGMLDLSNENYEGLKEKNTNLHLKLIEMHQEKFVEEFNEFALDALDWNRILKSPLISISNKLALIKAFDDSLVVANRLLADTVCGILPVDEYVSLRFEVMEAMFSAHASTQKRLALLNLHFDYLDDSQVQSLIEKLGGDYSRIFKKMHKPVFANTALHLTLFNKLEERDLIIRFEPVEKTKALKVFANYQQ